MFRKAILSILLVFFIFSTGRSETITLAYVDFPPYEYVENDQPRGILVEIVQKAFNSAGIAVEFHFLPFKRAYEQVKWGTTDGLFNFYKIPERLPYFDYSVPIIKNPLVFFVRKDSRLRFQTLDDLNRLKIGVMRGYTYGTEFDQSRLFTKEPTDSHLSNLLKIVRNRIDAYPCDKRVCIHVANQHDLMDELKILPKPLRVMEGHIGFTKGKHGNLIERINREILRMHLSKEIDAIIERHIHSE